MESNPQPRIVQPNSLAEDFTKEAPSEMTSIFGEVVFVQIDIRNVGTVSFLLHEAARCCIAALDTPGFEVGWLLPGLEVAYSDLGSGSDGCWGPLCQLEL